MALTDYWTWALVCDTLQYCVRTQACARDACLGRCFLHARVSQPAHMMQLYCLDAAILCIAPWGYPRGALSSLSLSLQAYAG